MSIPSLIIKRITGGDYRIDDLGIVVPNTGQTEITGLHAIRDALCSADLHAAAEAADLVLNDGSRDIPVAEISCFVRRFDTGHVDDVETYTDLPGTGVERQIYLVADTKTTYMWNGSGWSQINVAQKRCNGAIVSKFDDSLPTAYAHPSGNGVTTYERFQDGAANAAGAGFAGASREWIAGGGGAAGGGDFDGGVGGDLIARPGTGGAGSGTGSEGGRGRFIIYQSDIKAVSTDGLLLENETAATVGDPVQMAPRIRLRGYARDTDPGSSESADWIIENLPTSGTTISAAFKVGCSISGAAYSYPLQVYGNGITVCTVAIQSPKISPANANSTFTLQNLGFNNSNSVIEAVGGTMTQGDGETIVGMMVRPTYTQTGTASGVDFVVSRKENSVGTGPQLLMDLGTCTTAGDYSTHTSKWKCTNAGVVTQSGALNVAEYIYTVAGRGLIMRPGTAYSLLMGTYGMGVNSVFICADDTSKTIVLTAYSNRATDHDHAAQSNPTLFIHSATDPNTANTQWGSFAHDTSKFVVTGGLGMSFATTSNGDITLQPNGTGIVIVDAAEIKVKSGKKLSLGDGGAATDAGTWYNGVHVYFDLISGDYYFQHNSVTKWAWTSTEVYTLDGYYWSLGSGGSAADWYAKYTGTNCEMKIVNGEWQFFGGASEVYVINSTGQHGWFGKAPTSQQAHIADPTGGGTVDTEARAAIAACLLALENYGLLAAA